ncbi:acyl-CoA synthetase (AMP-forming)/AMP-acid ligase II [Actinocorallia herbida]|uniref:Acyl-CoA synthetase (AMP-forming)/AMP-acid ligase II n=1 Tax=Actinocorallia herbida TaxID=58109 RepID=A0A3N1D307_9ACTN|nr:fatty acid--CoA ligase family protein [Actinocorallia herbida]ROO87909.1 acyl-CoA synthetase (AMP-forming)/AMP-acid ligase II [Actinocorallia herbida]
MNLTMLLDMAADGFGDRIIVGDREAGFTAERLRALAIGAARAVRDQGADAIIYLAVNGPAFPVAMFAAAYAGVPLVPVNYRLGADQLAALLANHPGAYKIGGDGGVSTEEFLGAAHEAAGDEPEPLDPSAPAVLIYTSGTTSAPKGVVLRHENLVSYVFGSVEFAAAEADEAALMSVPPYHIAAVSNVLTNLYAGRRFLTLHSFSAPEWLRLVREQRVTNAMVVPTMLARIMDDPGLDRSVPSLRALAYGGAKMPPRVIENALAAWPHVDFVNAYGLTETSSTVAVLGPEDHRAAFTSDDPAVRARLNSAGTVLPTVELEIRDEDGAILPAGATGRIFIRGDQVAGEYAGVGSTVDERGFFDTRDAGRLDADGYLFVEGRIDDTIIRGAENIAPAEIEDVLMRHPHIADACVVGLPDEEWGQRLAAVVVPVPGGEVNPDEVRAYVRERLRSSKTPDTITCWPDLPRTPTGKILRRSVVDGLIPTA